jgi:hypothetical protein
MRMRMLVCLALLFSSSLPAFGGAITNGNLNVEVSDGNGAIRSTVFDGKEFFREGTYVSNFGFQVGNDTSTFLANDAYGSSGVGVTVSSNQVSGSFAGIQFTRSYSLVSGLDVLRISTNFINDGAATTLSYFDTFDPDQDLSVSGFGTFNDVFGIASIAGIAGQATGQSGLSFLLGSVDSRATVASGGPFGIFEGNALNDFFDNPVDGDGSFGDTGTHIGLRTRLASGQSTSFVIDLAFGSTAAEAKTQFILANSGIAPVPEPTTIAILGLGSVLGMCSRFRRKK